MNTHQLQCFLCVADKLNFTKAAEALYLSTPTVTHHIKSMEEELNTKLFHRTSRMVRLTESGTIFYNDAKDLLVKFELSKKHIEKAATRNISFIGIGCSSNTELEHLVPVLSVLSQGYPLVYPRVVVDNCTKLITLFKDHQLDILLTTKELVKDTRDCTFKKTNAMTTYAIMPTDAPLSDRAAISFEDLEQNRLIILRPKLIPFQYGNKLQEKITLHSQHHFNMMCENDQEAMLLVRSGYGVAILPEFCISANMVGLAVIPIEGPKEMDYGIAYYNKPKENHIRCFIENFKRKFD